MLGKKIYLSVGDYYENIPFDEDAPCRLRDGTLCYLRDAKKKNVTGDFSVWTGSHWDSNVCLSDKVTVHASLEIELCRQLSSKEREELIEDLYSLFKQNDIRFVNYVSVILKP